MENPVITNAKGDPILLNQAERRRVELMQRHVNALGYEANITTLTTVIKKVSEQKFFEIMPGDVIPIRVGEGAWSSNLLAFRSFALADDFETGNINTGQNNARLASADVGIDTVPQKINNWAKSIGWTLFDVELATKSGNWDLIAAKEAARKKNWDLGIQKIAFLGSSSDTGIAGLYNQAGITNNLSLITKPLRSMSATELGVFLGQILDAYRSNNGRTAWPTHFLVPESDYLGLATPSSDTQPIKSKLQLMEETLKIMTKNPNFQVLPNAYGDNAYSGLGVQKYVLLNSDEGSLRMTIPVDYNSTMANSVDNFSFQNVGYGQYTGVMALRQGEILYFQY